MNRFFLVLLLCGAGVEAEVVEPGARPIDLAETIRMALEGSPRVRIALLRVERSATDMALVRSERSMQLGAGSGLGATHGIPQSIQGAAPSVAQVTLRQPLIDARRPRRAAAARARARSAGHEAAGEAEGSAYRAGLLYLDFEFAQRELARLESELDHFRRIERLARLRVEEGVEIPLALSRARLDAARAGERLDAARSRTELLEAELRFLLGLGPDVRLRPDRANGDRTRLLEQSARSADPRPLAEHPAMVSLAEEIDAARHRAGAARASRFPKVDVVGQYSLLGRFNNYDEFFRRFQRHNWQAGVALELPLFGSRGVAEEVARARLEERELEVRRETKRSELELQGQRALAGLRAAERGAELARQELEFARESLDVLLARFEEEQIPLDELERARVLESTAWGGLVSSRYALAKAQLGVVYATGRIRDAFAD